MKRASAANLLAFFGVFLGALGLILLGCGRPATRQDCELIIDKNVELEMKQLKIEDTSAIERRKTEIRASMEGQLNGCIGKRVTDGMMKCVKNANSTDEIDGCMR